MQSWHSVPNTSSGRARAELSSRITTDPERARDRRVCRGVRVDRRGCKGVVLYPGGRLAYRQLCGLVQRPSETGAVIAHIGRCWSGTRPAMGPSTTGSCLSRAEFSGDSGYWFPTAKADLCWFQREILPRLGSVKLSEIAESQNAQERRHPTSGGTSGRRTFRRGRRRSVSASNRTLGKDGRTMRRSQRGGAGARSQPCIVILARDILECPAGRLR